MQNFSVALLTALPLAFTYDFFVSPTGGTGAGTIGDPWSWTYAIGTGAGTAQGDGKLPTTGAHVGVRAGTYAQTNTEWTIAAHGALGSGVDALDGKLIFRAYRSSQYALPEVAKFIHTASGNPPTSTSNINVSGTFVWLWDLDIGYSVSTRVPASEPSGFNVACYQLAPTGLKIIHSVIHDGPGGVFLDSRDAAGNIFDGGEIYGSIFYNQGWAMGDGGGHHIYSHHKGSLYRRNVQANIFGPDEANGVQHFSVAGIYAWEQNFDHTDNIHFNSGTLNNINGLGATTGSGAHLVLGGNTSANAHMNSVTAKRNYFYWPDNFGDIHIWIGQGGADQIGAGCVVDSNYGRGAGAGYATIRIASILAAGGTLSLQGNTFRVQGGDATHNGRCVVIAENGGAGYTMTGNSWIRALSTNGDACGPDSVTPQTFADATGQCRTLAQFKTDCGFSGDTITLADPAVTAAFNIAANKYENGRSHVVYYNWASLTRIPVDLSNTLTAGTAFRVDDWRDISGVTPITVYDAASGGNAVTTYTGALVYFPTTQLADPVMVGSNWGVGVETAPPATAPFFNAFLVRRTG